MINDKLGERLMEAYENMNYIKHLVEELYSMKPTHIEKVGGGFYANVFLVQIPQEPFKLIVKIYKTALVNEREKKQLEELRGVGSTKIPRIYFCYSETTEIPINALIMEYINGVDAGSVLYPSERDREIIADQITDILISFHETVNEKGFGELEASTYYENWNEYYKGLVDQIIIKAEIMRDNIRLSKEVYEIMKYAYLCFDKIFSVPVKKASLIHGDYNMWNIMIDRSSVTVVAVIDPYNCCWADSEFDLYQLNNSYGKEYGLLESYKKKKSLSEDFELKSSFYELFAEVMHYYDSGTPIIEVLINRQADALRSQLQKNNI